MCDKVEAGRELGLWSNTADGHGPAGMGFVEDCEEGRSCCTEIRDLAIYGHVGPDGARRRLRVSPQEEKEEKSPSPAEDASD